MKIKKGNKVLIKSMEEIKNSKQLKLKMKGSKILAVTDNTNVEIIIHDELYLLGKTIEILYTQHEKLYYGINSLDWIREDIIEEVVE